MKGIYSIVNNTNDCVYIGSTAKSIRCRWNMHRSMLRNGSHHNKHLQHAWDKYGEEAFGFFILEEMDGTPEKILRHEQVWLDFHRMSGDIYNLVFYVTNTTLGYRYTEEQRQEIRDRLAEYHPMRGKQFSEEVRCNMKAGHKRGKEHHSYGRKHTKESKEKMRLAHVGRVFSEEHCRNISKAKGKPYPAFYNIITGEIITAGVNLQEMCRERKLYPAAMRRLVSGKQKVHLDWILGDGI